MSERKGFVNPLLILGLVIPVSILYLVRVIVTSASYPWAAIGYVTMGLSFGLLQSLFRVRRPYLVAFVSTALIPALAYLVLAGLAVLISLLSVTGVLDTVVAGMSGGVPVTPMPYTQRLGRAAGLVLFVAVMAVIIIPFGTIGVSGRFLGSDLLPRLIARIAHRKVTLLREGDAVLLGPPESEDIKTTKITAYATITAAAISALASVLIAFLK